MDDTLRPLINTLGIVIITALLGMLTTWFWFQKSQTLKRAEELKNTAEKKASDIAIGHAALLQRVTELETLQRIATATLFQAKLIQDLTHDHTQELDVLLAKVGDGTLEPHEEPRLMVLLDERTRDTDPRISAAERETAAIFPVVMRMARVEIAERAASLASPLLP